MRRWLASCVAALALLSAPPAAAQEAYELTATTTKVASGEATDLGTADLPQRASMAAIEEVEQTVIVSPDGAVAAAKPSPPPPPAVTLVLEADLTAQRLTVLEAGNVKHVWPISSGRQGYATPTGTYRPAWMAKMWHSRQYDDAPMPHSVFFNGGVAFHATSAVGMLGRPASHGCVRLAPANAAQLYALVRRHGLTSTKVVVHGAPKFREPSVIARRAPAMPKAEAAFARERGNVRVSRYGQPFAGPQWFFAQ